jgi:hypothetical protein
VRTSIGDTVLLYSALGPDLRWLERTGFDLRDAVHRARFYRVEEWDAIHGADLLLAHFTSGRIPAPHSHSLARSKPRSCAPNS